MGRKFGYRKPNRHVTLEEVVQQGACPICRERLTLFPPKLPTHFAVDHKHSTGYVRGVLCRNCNAGLGYFQDSPERLQQAVEYLLRTQAEEDALPIPLPPPRPLTDKEERGRIIREVVEDPLLVQEKEKAKVLEEKLGLRPNSGRVALLRWRRKNGVRRRTL